MFCGYWPTLILIYRRLIRILNQHLIVLLAFLFIQDRLDTHCVEAPHCKQICHHSAEARSQTWLSNEAKLEFCQTDDIITLLPIPAGNVEKVGLGNRVMILKVQENIYLLQTFWCDKFPKWRKTFSRGPFCFSKHSCCSMWARFRFWSRYLVVILHQLDDDPDIITVVLDGDDSHDVGSILCIRIRTILVGQI